MMYTWIRTLLCGVLLLNLFGTPEVGQAQPATCATTGIAGVLRVSSANPRYFTNDCGKAIYLAGSHTWNNFPDMDDAYPPENAPFNYDHYLDFLDQYNHNFFRLWVWEGPFPNNADRYARRVWAGPQPWLRTGPGTDSVGLPRFDLTRWNQAYFDRMRSRVLAAQNRGKFLAIMLFDGWELQFAPGAAAHPFNSGNNINGLTVPGGSMPNLHTLQSAAITALQEEYVRRIIDSVNDLDNFTFEISNESGNASTAWQFHMIDFIRQYEATKPKQHPVGMTFQYPDGNNSTLFNSSADWVSPNEGQPSYITDPPLNSGAKIIVNDTDHLTGSCCGDRTWVWKSFMRGLNTLFMDRYDLPDSITDGPISTGIEIRRAMGDTRTFSQRINLLTSAPSTTLASTHYALANPQEVLVYSPSTSSFTVNLSSYSGTLQAEWFDPVSRQTVAAPDVQGGATRTFQPPFNDQAVLYLHSASASVTPAPPQNLTVH